MEDKEYSSNDIDELLLLDENLNRKLSRLKKDVEEVRKKNRTLQEKEKKIQNEYNELLMKLNKVVQDRNKANHKLKMIINSNAWKLLFPLRVVGRISNKISRKLKRSINNSFNNSTNEKNEQRKKIKSTVNKNSPTLLNRIKGRLYNLGFIESGLKDLEKLYRTTKKAAIKRAAARELILWYSNQYSEEGAKESLSYYPSAVEGEKNADRKRELVVMEAESLSLLGKKDNAKKLLLSTIESAPHIDLYFALANLEELEEKKIKWINEGLEIYGIWPISLEASNSVVYNRLQTKIQEENKSKNSAERMAKVTVIIPVYNAEGVIKTTLDSILNQTWSNLEIIVVDDCSTDSTINIVEEYVKKDSRIKLIKCDTNSGAYVSRNFALQKATGDYVTVNDADDWSHAMKIETQVEHLIDNPAIIGNTSEQARTTNDLQFYRRGKFGTYTYSNMSSFMFRRKEVMEKIGYWDCVRFAADAEYIGRIKKVYGDKAVVDLETGPLSFQRQSEHSLTGDEVFGYHGYKMGARKEYHEGYTYYHSVAKTLRYEFPQTTRPFAVPEPMWPTKEERDNEYRHFDVILVSDFRMQGGSNLSNIEEIKAMKRMDIRVGLIQMARYDYPAQLESTNPKVRELIDGDQIQLLVYGEKVTCGLMILRYPPILQKWQKYIPEVKAKYINIIVNQTPMSDYGENGVLRYNMKEANELVIKYFKKTPTWFPIGPLVRKALHDHHSEEKKWVQLSDEDWSNIIDVDEWRRDSKPHNETKIIIGRVSRDNFGKWPEDPNQLLSIYPSDNEYEVLILGGAEVPKKTLGELPNNWKVKEFGSEHPKDFLAKIDVFVYYTHPGLVEAFGRVIIEAMAVGVPVIIPHHYKELFGEAAIYAEPSKVQEEIKKLMAQEDYYDIQVQKALNYVENNFGYSKHHSRVNKYLKS